MVQSRLRKKAITDGRCLVRVRRASTGRTLTMAVCPGCWNNRAGRQRILEQLGAKGLSVVAVADTEAGTYLPSARHCPRCPHQAESRPRCQNRPSMNLLPLR